MRIALIAWIVAWLAACVGAKPYVYHPDVVAVVDTDSDKAVQVVYDERLSEHEPRQVPESAVASALLASGMFLDDDARTLAPPITKRLATMESDEALRIVGWAADAPRYYYVWIHGGKLQIAYYAGAQRSDEYSAVLPTEAVAITAPPDPDPPKPDEPPPPPVTPDAGAVAKAPAPVAHKKHVAPANYRPLTEAEARQKMRELEEAVSAGLINQKEYTQKRKEILARL